MDSRTLFYRGVVAFQSALSPLSNLFPCKVRFNGLTYLSTEQAYQHAKCLYHGLPQVARDIRHEPDPHVIMAIGTAIEEDDEWLGKKTRSHGTTNPTQSGSGTRIY